jgi:hypothetical protein
MLQRLLQATWQNPLTSGIFGIDSGPSSQENSQYGALNSSSGFATGMGESDLSTASNFMQAIVSGDSAKISKVLAPQISGIQKRAQEQKQTTSQFGNRSGGTNASMQTVDDSAKSDVNKMISDLTGSAVSGLASTGSGLLSAGMYGEMSLFGEGKMMQDQKAAKWQDLFKSIASISTSALGAIPGNPGGFADVAGNAAGGMS